MLRQWSKVLSVGLIATGIVVSACGDDESPGDGVRAGSGGKGGSGGTSSGSGGTPSGGSSTAGTSEGGSSAASGAGGEGNTTSVAGTSTTGGTSTGGTSTTAGTSGKGGSSGTVGTSGGSGGDGGFGGFDEGGFGGAEGGFGGEVGYAGDGGSGGSGAPPIDVELGAVFSPSVNLPLSPKGVNFATVELTGDPTVPLTVTLTALASPGATVPTPSQQISLAAGEAKTVSVQVNGTDVTSGGGQVVLTATPNPGLPTDAVSKSFYIDFYGDLARNHKPPAGPIVADDPALAPFPHAYASSSQGVQPPWMAFDTDPGGEGKSDANTFWVSNGSAVGDGPTPEHPEWLAVDFGAPVQIGSVTVVQRTNGSRRWRPRTYIIQTSDTGEDEDWSDVKEETDVPNESAPTVSAISPKVNARYLRLFITAAHDPGGASGCVDASGDACANPRNVQIAGLEVRP